LKGFEKFSNFFGRNNFKLIRLQILQSISNCFKLLFCKYFKEFQRISKNFKSFANISSHFKQFQRISHLASNRLQIFNTISKNFKEFLTLLQIGCLIWRRSGWWPRPTCTSFEGHHEQLKLLLRLERFSSTLCSQKKKGFLNCNIL
jgi:hypothetical protein